MGDSDHLYFLGIRSIESDELEFYQNNKINVLSAADVDHLGVPAALERMVSHMKRFSKVYITLDIDCLDPAYAAGTGTPQFGGLTARQLLDLLKGLFDGLNIIGMDVGETKTSRSRAPASTTRATRSSRPSSAPSPSRRSRRRSPRHRRRWVAKFMPMYKDVAAMRDDIRRGLNRQLSGEYENYKRNMAAGELAKRFKAASPTRCTSPCPATS